MFSTQMPPVPTAPREYLFMGAGLLLITSLLVAIAMVASGQVQKAQARDAMLASQQTAMAYCVQTLRGDALSNCMRHAKAEMYNDGADSTVAGNASSGGTMATGQSRARVDNMAMMPVSFSATR